MLDAFGICPRIEEVYIEVRADDREWIAQLVRSVRDKAPLCAERLVEAREHPVEGVGKTLELVVRPLETDALGEVGCLDPLSHARDAIDGSEHAAGDDPPHHKSNQEQDRQAPERKLTHRRQHMSIDGRLEHPGHRPLLHEEARSRLRIDRHDPGDILRHSFPLKADVEGDVDRAQEQSGEQEERGGVNDRDPPARRTHPLRQRIREARDSGHTSSRSL